MTRPAWPNTTEGDVDPDLERGLRSLLRRRQDQRVDSIKTPTGPVWTVREVYTFQVPAVMDARYQRAVMRWRVAVGPGGRQVAGDSTLDIQTDMLRAPMGEE